MRQCAFLLHDANRQLLPQDWSLGVELKGSALIPLFLFLAHRQRVVLLFILAAILLVFVGTGHYYVSFIIGVLLAQYGDSLGARFMPTKRSNRIGILLIGLLLYHGYGLIVGQLFGEAELARKCGWTITGLGCAIILLSVFNSPTLQKLLNHKAAVWLGRISYSVYLIQFIVILCLLLPLVKILNGWGIHQPAIIMIFSLLVSVSVTVGCAALTYRYIEVPTINWGHRLTKKIQSRFQK